MKDLVRRVNSFILFETQSQTGSIEALFISSQNQHKQKVQGWEASSTRQQLIARYWFTHVKVHFTAIVGLPLLLLWPVFGIFQPGYLVVLFGVSLISFVVLLFAQYWPTYCSEFLPRLEAVVSASRQERQQKVIRELHEQLAAGREQADRRRGEFEGELYRKLAGQQAEFLLRQETLQAGFAKKLAGEKERSGRRDEEVKKCRHAQLSNFALTLVFYALSKAAGKGNIIADDHTAGLLLKLYGVDKGSLRTCLTLVAGGCKIKDMGERKRTELRNRFGEAIDFFDAMGFQEGINIVRELEMRITTR